MDSNAKLARRSKVLSIDSGTRNQAWVMKVLATDFEVQTAPCTEQCIEVLRKFTPDIILLDVDLPNFDSLRICQMIRNESKFARTPMLFVSHVKNHNKPFKGFKAGADDYLQKPINADQLKRKLMASVERTRIAARSHAGDDQGYASLEQNIQYLHEYLQALIGMKTPRPLGELALATLEKLGLKGAIYWHSTGLTHSTIGPLSDLEAVLLQQATQTFPQDHSARYVWGSPKFGATIHNMPSPKSEHYKSMRQIVAQLFKATEAKAQDGAAPHYSIAMASNDLNIYGFKIEAAIETLESQCELHLRKIAQALQNMSTEPERDEQEKQSLLKLLDHCVQTRINIYDQCLEIQTQYQRLVSKLENKPAVPNDLLD